MKNFALRPYIGRIIILSIFILVVLGASLNLASEPAPYPVQLGYLAGAYR